MGTILDGRALSKDLKLALGDKVQESGLEPKLAVVFDPTNDGSRLYVGMKQRAAAKVGIATEDIAVDPDVTTEAVLKIVADLNADDTVTGILVQAPLPEAVNDQEIFSAIAPAKDVDGLGAYNQGMLFGDQQGEYAVAATPQGVMTMLAHYDINPYGKKAVVVGRSQLFGRPMAALLNNADATVTLAHRYTPREMLLAELKDADIVVVGVGIPNFITGDQIKDGAVLVDVGMNVVDGKATGDIDFDSAVDKASFITPVPGGVGPMTIATLLENTYQAALNQNKQ
ncbi:methenyltetrahydrofolate cyclohydrolase [Fructobacillus pseudoficulneus]|uniref:Bifunctional protein FolD n=1 Tax=Fructobacillus pseudoficulneus TaxID=220714 RepID=A0A3F3H1I8_9LACO|nr:bifunctional 5,10-methylenetetrahydrofolate dehydrogenase/5,10-methenyltetrahydrofolate cyclohydrolase [Fructobacillus pseudoficulneus]GAP02478.1 methenyltetrahydrofolate cyclohydrolase [Fructobacillus pseudoficulneus]SEH37159.1 methylenetetrahydrofolate dehydrogenase (NADP+) / methenyltetrahydrofolate cyclohydrolase [Fructobacillus pseudoficulneus]